MKFSLILLVAAVSAVSLRTEETMQAEEDQVLAQEEAAEEMQRHHHHHHRRHHFFKKLGRDLGNAAKYLEEHPKLDE